MISENNGGLVRKTAADYSLNKSTVTGDKLQITNVKNKNYRSKTAIT